MMQMGTNLEDFSAQTDRELSDLLYYCLSSSPVSICLPGFTVFVVGIVG